MKVSLLGVGLLALTTTVGFAQAAPAAAPTKVQNMPAQHKAVTINQRRALQQHRIAQGVRRGTLNARQAGRFERKEVSIGRQERRMRAHHNGRLTRANRVRLNRKLNHSSRAIYRANHRNLAKNRIMKQ